MLFASLAIGMSALLTAANPTAEKKQLVAIFNFEVDKLPLNAKQVASLNEQLVDRLSGTGKYQVLTRAEMAKNSAYAECFAEACRIEVGRQLAAHISLAPKVAKAGSSCNITLTMYDLRKGASLGTATNLASCNDDGFSMAIEKTVRKLAKSTGEKATVEKEALAEKEALEGEKDEPELPSQPSDESVELRMKFVRVSISTCAKQYRFRGAMNAKFTVSPSGSVVRVSTKGAGGPFADCAQRTIRTTQFEPSSEGGTFEIPFVLR